MFNADLSRYVAHRPSILHWIFNSKAGFGEIGMGLLRAIQPWNEWIAGWGFDMAAGEPDLSDDVVLEADPPLVGDPDLEVELVRKSLWYVNQQHATNYQVGRVFCGGDAVHRHPPSSGLGSNTSMQDAFNLAWKVAFVVKGHAGRPARLLHPGAGAGRQADRRPRQPVPKGLRRAAGVVRPRQRRPGPRRPGQAQGGQPRGRRARERLYEALEHKNTEFNAQAWSSTSATSPAPCCPIPSSARRSGRATARSTCGHQASRAKIPHAWLVGPDGTRVSTLDVTGKGR